jgi:hypothetical protein
MDKIQLTEIVDAIGYKDGWKLLLRHDGRYYLQWQFTTPDYQIEGQPQTSWKSRKWYLSEYMTEGEVVQTAMAAAIRAEEHEAREAFTYKERFVFNPHISIDAMLEVCDRLEVRA